MRYKAERSDDIGVRAHVTRIVPGAGFFTWMRSLTMDSHSYCTLCNAGACLEEKSLFEFLKFLSTFA